MNAQKYLDNLDHARLFLPASFVSKLSGRPLHPVDLVLVKVRKL